MKRLVSCPDVTRRQAGFAGGGPPRRLRSSSRPLRYAYKKISQIVTAWINHHPNCRNLSPSGSVTNGLQARRAGCSGALQPGVPPAPRRPLTLAQGW